MKFYKGEIFLATTQQDVIKKFMASLDTTTKSGTAALNEAIKACTNSKYTTIQAVIDKMVADCKSTNNATKFLNDYCGIILENNFVKYGSGWAINGSDSLTGNFDTGAITGSDAGGSTTAKTAESIVPESGSLINFTGNSFTTNGLTFELITYIKKDTYNNLSEHYKSLSYNSLTSAQKYIWQGLYTWWAKNSLDLISDSYGSNFGFDSNSSATVKKIHVYFTNENTNALAWVNPWPSNDYSTVQDLDLAVNMKYYSSVNTSDPNGESSNKSAGYLDRTLAHEFTHAVMGANINYFNNLPLFIVEGMAELTHGIDDERGGTILELANSSASLKSALNLSETGTASNGIPYAAGYMFLRYLAKQFADSTSTEETVSGPFTEGADYYENSTANTILSALGGNDTVRNNANNVQIYGNAGNDSIKNLSNYVTMDGGAGNDSLENWDGLNSYVTIYGGAGNDFVRNGGSKVFISLDDGADYAYSWVNYTTILSGAGNDSVDITGNYATVDGGTGSDSLYSQGSNNSVSGGDDNDLLYSYNKYNLFDGGAGNDSLSTNASNNTLKGGAGNDSIHYVHGGSNLIMGETGNDTVNILSSNNTVIGGTDNDLVSLSSSASNNLIRYASGDGNDTVYGFKTSDTLDVIGAKYSTVKSGNDLIVKVGSGSVLLKNAATLSSANIKGTLDSGSSSTSIFTEGADYYENKTANTILSALGGNDTIKNKAKYVTINGGAGNDEIYPLLFYSDYSFVNGDAGDDWLDNDAESVTMNGGDGNDTLRTAKNFFGNTPGEYSVLNGDAGNDFIYSNSYKITINGGKDNDKVSLDSYASNNLIQYASGDGNDTVYGFKTSDTLDVIGAKYSTVKSGNDLIVKVGSGSVLLKNAATLSSAKINGTLEGSNSSIFTEGDDEYVNDTANTVLSALGGNDDVFNSASNVQIYGNAGNDFLSNANGKNVIGGNNVTLDGGAGNDTLYNNGNNVLLLGGEGNDNIQNIATIGEGTTMNQVTVNGGKGDDVINITPYAKYARNNVVQYASGDGNDTVSSFDPYDMLHITSGSISKTSVSGNNFIVYVGDGRITFKNFADRILTVKLADGTVTTLRAESKTEETASWKISGTTATYGTNSKTLVTVSGINKNATVSNFSLDGKTVTLSANALGTSKVTISNGYTLALADDVATPSATSAAWKVSGTTATLSSGTSAGYTLSTDKKSVTYSVAKSSSTLTTIKGVNKKATAEDFSLNGKTVTLSANALGTNKVTISNGYTLALADDVATPSATSAAWKVSGTTATLSSGTSAGYTLSTDKKSVTYSKATSGKILTTVSGINENATADDFSLTGNIITLSESALDENSVAKVSGDYKLALDSNVTKSKTTSAGWSVKKTTATYKTAGTSEGYVLSDDEKSVSYTSEIESTTEITLKGLKSGLKSSGGKISGITLSDNSVKLSTSVLGKNGASVSGGGYTFTLSDKGRLKNIGKAAELNGSKKNDTLVGGKGADTLNGGGGKDNLNGGKGNDIISGGAGNDTILGGSGADSLSGGKGKDILSGSSGNDSIFGGAGNDSILGGSGTDYLSGDVGNDTLNGGTGSDTLTGGKGKDIFTYAKSTGNDIITDYTSADKIKISSGSISKTTYDGNDVIFKIGKGTLTVQNGKGKKISIVNSKGKTSTKTYSDSTSSNISELWFAEENNFVSSDNISSITENNLIPTSLEKIGTNNFENLTQENNFIAYSTK